MSDCKADSSEGFEIRVSADQMRVMLYLDAGAAVGAAAVIGRLREMDLGSFDDGIVVEALEKAKGAAVAVAVASGTPAVDERSQRIEYLVHVADDGSAIVVKVEAGQRIATMTTGTPGIAGCDVFGKPVAPKTNQNAIQIGKNLNVVKNEIISKLRGNLHLDKNVLWVEPLLEIRGDDGHCAPICFDGDAVIKGSLNEGHVLDITGSLAVGGAVEPALVKTGGLVTVKGGIIGRQKGKYQIGGDLRCRFISGGLIVAGADVFVQSEVNASHIVCRGRLTVAHGSIFGGAVSANGGISCTILGHPSGTPTVVEAGDGSVCRSIFASAGAQIAANRKRVSEIRAKIEPLLKIMKHLTGQQREKATELLYEADELEAATDKLVADSQDQLGRLLDNSHAEILVSELLYPGVKVRFPGVETVVNTAFKGPFTLTVRKTAGPTDILLIDATNQSCTVLPSHLLDAEESARLVHLAEIKAA